MTSSTNRLRIVPLEHRSYMLVDEVMGAIGRTINYFYDNRDELIDTWGFPQPARGARPYRVAKDLGLAWVDAYLAGMPAKDLKTHMARKRRQMLEPANDEEGFDTSDQARVDAILRGRLSNPG